MNSIPSRRFVALLALAALPFFASASALQAEALPILKPAPAWTLTSLDGKPIGLDALKGKVVVVDFWATWCPPCVHEIPGYIALQKKYADRGLVIIGLSVDQKGPPVVEAFAKKTGVNYALAMATPEVMEAFGGVQGIPTTFLIDRDGQIRHQKVGQMAEAEYEKLIVPLL